MRTLAALSALVAVAVASPAQADTEPSAELEAVAEEAGVDAVALLGAVNTTGLPAKEYLYQVGELARPAPVYSVWDRIAACESGGNWAANTGNGFYGGVQFDLPSWRAAGGVGLPHQASRATQIAVAERWLALTSWRSWPACARRLGLR